MNFRDNGKSALSMCLTIPKNVNIIESVIYKESGDDLYKYNYLIFQCIDAITNGYKLSDLVSDIKKGTIDCSNINPPITTIKEECESDDEYGISCSNCGSKRSITYARKLNDVVMATCINCKNKWVHSS
jgi:hypothetical protein